MKSSISQFFDTPGYILLEEYLTDIFAMKKYGPWKLPLSLTDKIQLKFLSFVVRFSWFSPRLYLEYQEVVSPSYALLLGYLRKHHFFDNLAEKDLHCRGYYAFHLRRDMVINGRTIPIIGQGVAKDRATALSTAIGETLERMVTGVCDMTPVSIVESPEVLMKRHKQVLYPPRHHRMLEVQKKKYKELNYNVATKINWVRGENLVTRGEVFIPRQLTSWFKERRYLKELFLHATTSGSAGFFDRDTAVLRGLLEVVQRDGFLVHWLTKTIPRRIANDTLPGSLQERIFEFESLGITIYITDITSLSIPTAFVVAINRQAIVPQVVVSSATALTFEEAVASALKEIVVGIEMFYYPENFEDLEGIDKIVEPFISNLEKVARQLYWRGDDMVKKFEWFISGKVVSFEEVSKNDLPQEKTSKEKIKVCIDILKKYGEEYYPVVYYPKHPIQEKLGFYVVQVFIPKAFPLYLFEGYGTFDSDRLHEFAKSKGVKEWNLNHDPHMFS